jgi:hypothetical protein
MLLLPGRVRPDLSHVGGLVLPGAHPDPGGQVLGGGQPGHVAAGFGDDDLGSQTADPGDGVEVFQTALIPGH